MTGGDIAGLIAAVVFAVLVGLLAVPLLKLGKVFDKTTESIEDVTEHVTPMLDEATLTIASGNQQLARVDEITGNIADVTGNASALVALFAATVGGPLIKLAGFSAGVRAAFSSGAFKRHGAKAKPSKPKR